jgi:hypothetical protein
VERARNPFTNRGSRLPAPRSAAWTTISRRCSSTEEGETKMNWPFVCAGCPAGASVTSTDLPAM